MGLMDREYMRDGEKPSKRKPNRRKVDQAKLSKHISRKDKKAAIDAFIKGTPIQPSKPSLLKRLFNPKK